MQPKPEPQSHGRQIGHWAEMIFFRTAGSAAPSYGGSRGWLLWFGSVPVALDKLLKAWVGAQLCSRFAALGLYENRVFK